MLLLKNITEKKFRLITYGVVSISIFFITIYVSNIYSELYEKNYEENLSAILKQYEHSLSATLDEYYSIAGIMSMSFAKSIDNDKFIRTAKDVMQTSMLKHRNICLSTLVLKTNNEKDIDTMVISDDSIHVNSLSLIAKDDNIVAQSFDYENFSRGFKNKVNHLTGKEQTKIMMPEVINLNNKISSVIPIISTIFKGKYFLGYLILFIDISNQYQNNSIYDDYQIYAFSQEGKLISSNNSQLFLYDDISKVCSTCNTNFENNDKSQLVTTNDNIKTICIATNLNNNIENINVCIRGNIDKHPIQNNILMIRIFGILAIAIYLFFFYYTSAQSKYLWKMANSMIAKLYTGNFNADEFKNTYNEGQKEVKNSLVKVNNALQTIADNNLKVLSDKYSDIKTISDFNNELYDSSQKLYSKFEDINSELKTNNETLEQIKYNTDNLDKIIEIIQENYGNIELMLDTVITKIVNLLNFSMGTIFLKKTVNNELWLEQIVSYAYNEKKNNKKRFKFGDSLVGACALEKRTVHLKQVPDDYLKIVSGLGDASPTCILIVPLVFEDQVIGVIELGALDEIKQNTIKFIEKISANISGVLSLAQNNLEYKKTIKQIEQEQQILKEQNKTMKDTIDHLQTTQNKIAENESIIRAKLEAANQSLMIAEYDTQGVLLDANFKFLNTLHFSLEEIQQKNISELVVDDEKEKIHKIINTVKVGNYFESSMFMYTKQGKSKQIYVNFAPMFDDTGVVINILFFGIAIT